MTGNQVKSRPPAAVYRLLLLFFFLVLLACSSEEKIETQQQAPPDGFTFFNIHSNTVYSKSLRERLVETLSSDAIEYRSVINLEIVQRGFLQRHFPGLDELNRRLNYPPGERVEHPTVKLMYRWTARKDLPFSYVELLFSQDTRRPLYVKIEATRNISDVIDSLSEKYGSPAVQALEEGRGEIRYWENNRDVFLVATMVRKNERPLYRMMIYYASNLEAFIQAEEKKRQEQLEKQKREGRSAF